MRRMADSSVREVPRAYGAPSMRMTQIPADTMDIVEPHCNAIKSKQRPSNFAAEEAPRVVNILHLRLNGHLEPPIGGGLQVRLCNTECFGCCAASSTKVCIAGS